MQVITSRTDCFDHRLAVQTCEDAGVRSRYYFHNITNVDEVGGVGCGAVGRRGCVCGSASACMRGTAGGGGRADPGGFLGGQGRLAARANARPACPLPQWLAGTAPPSTVEVGPYSFVSLETRYNVNYTKDWNQVGVVGGWGWGLGGKRAGAGPSAACTRSVQAPAGYTR